MAWAVLFLYLQDEDKTDQLQLTAGELNDDQYLFTY